MVATSSITGMDSPQPKGFQFRTTISLGNIISMIIWLALLIAGWTSIKDNQAALANQQKTQAEQISRIVDREQVFAELTAREAALLDDMEKRVSRVENQLDGRKGFDTH